MKIKKFTISLILLLALVLPTTAYAQDTTNNDIEYLEDGSFFMTKLSESNGFLRSSKSATKSVTYYDSTGIAQWNFSLTGTFTYNNSTSSATGSSARVTIYKSSWSTTSKSASYSSNKATGTVKVSKTTLGGTTTIPKTLTITCSKTGTIS